MLFLSIKLPNAWPLCVPDLPILATSTNGLITAPDCLGQGVLEIKCPVSDHGVDELCALKSFCLQQNSDGLLKLKKQHQYYTQLQWEMGVTSCKWADFAVYTQTCSGYSMHVERVMFSQDFWATAVKKACKFYKDFIALEILTRRVCRNVKFVAV